MAKRKNTWQTGETEATDGPGGSYLAVDAMTNSSFEAGYCSSTWSEDRVWWTVDLVHSYRVETVDVTSRDIHGKSILQRNINNKRVKKAQIVNK